ncbi:hypothetical protein ACWENA_34015 [Streptomyces sp. NPDC004779]|uniref:hypothetical protein n=1 Tax=unclassified Streptomyces TaxID=2593676 RepID=UPI0035D90FD6
MSFGEPNNPYGQPPQGQPGYGYPQAPQGVPQQGAYGYPAAPPVAPYGAYPGGPNQFPQSMPGLLVTARVFLYLVAAAQIAIAIYFAYVAAIANDLANGINDVRAETGIDVAIGGAVIIALIAAGLAALSITLGVKFGNGGQGIRITTVVYGALGGVVGLILLFASFDTQLASAKIFPVLWVVFAAVITAAPVVPSGTAWFARPRY